MTKDKDVVVGIDLGTTNSVVAAVQDGKVVVIPVNGKPTMPSAVGLGADGGLIVGQAAKHQAIAAPERTVLSIKRMMGTAEKVSLGEKEYLPEEISAIILRELKKAAEAFLGCPVTKAVITVPAFFNERQRTATQDAGRLAGLEVLRIINEPTAAALAYGAGGADGKEQETVLVYDLGGGTFDVSLVSVEKGIVEVKSSHGDTHLGGDDFDEMLADAALERFLEVNRGEENEVTPLVRRRLKSVMEGVKIALSDSPETIVNEEFLTQGGHFSAEFTRENYEGLIAEKLEKTIGCLQRVLEDTETTVHDIDKVLLVGGATRTPRVHELLAEKMRKEPSGEVDPDLIVAMGAAIQGATLAGEDTPAILVDITAHSYSIEAVVFGDLECVVIIPRGTPLPAKKAKMFVTCADGQEGVETSVYQGESPYPEHNLALGVFNIEGLSKTASRGSRLLVTFEIDLNGLLHVSAIEKCTGKIAAITVDTAGHHRINIDAARTNLAEFFQEEGDASDDFMNGDFGDDEEFGKLENADFGADGDPQEAPSGLLTSAKKLRKRAEALLESEGVSANDAEEIRKVLTEGLEAIVKQNWEGLKQADERLSDLLFYLED